MQSSSRKKTFIRYIYRTQRSRQNERLSINQSTRHSKIVVIRITWSNIKQAYSTASSIKIFLLYLKISLSCSIVADGLPPQKNMCCCCCCGMFLSCLHSVHILGLKGIHIIHTFCIGKPKLRYFSPEIPTRKSLSLQKKLTFNWSSATNRITC